MNNKFSEKELKSVYSEENIEYFKSIFPAINKENFQMIKDGDLGGENRSGKKKSVPIWQKSNLTLEEAAAYFGIGMNKLRNMTEDESCPFVLWNGSRRLIKRRKLEEYLDRAYSI